MSGALVDAEARAYALTSRGVSLLVEAGAGSGKTTLMAGRIVSLLAGGASPRSIAAITFTEAAAAHLATVVHRHVQALLAGKVDVALVPAFGDGLTSERREALESATARLDELTITTLHGFAREILIPHPVEANLDPGASVWDARTTDEAFEATFDAWALEQLGGDRDGPFARFVRDAPDPRRDVRRLRAMATDLRDLHPVAPPSRPTAQAVTDAVDAALDAVRAWRERVEEHATWAPAAARDEARSVLRATEEADAAAPHHHRLRVPLAVARRSFVGRPPAKALWAAAAHADGATKKRGEEAWAACRDARGRAKACIEAVHTLVVDAVLADALDVVSEVDARFEEIKRRRAALDFTDLTVRAARLLADRPDVRDRLAGRYAHVLVDEFQDTDPVQAEIVWRITGVEGDDPDWRTWPSRPGARFVVGDPKQSIYAFRGADVDTYRTLARAMAADPNARVLSIDTNFRSVPAILDVVNRTFQAPLSDDRQPGFVPLHPRPGAGEGAGHVLPDLGVFKLEVSLQTPGAAADDVRDAAGARIADAVHDLLARGRRVDGEPLRPRDVALLAPSAAGLDVLEGHLRRRGIVVDSQAGKGYYRRQIVHDMIALTRALSDPTDTLAWAALLRGPLVGVTDEERLDALEHLRAGGAAVRALRIDLDPDALPPGSVREATVRFASLARRAAMVTPHQALSEAVAAVDVRGLVVLRDPERAASDLANVERFLVNAVPYATLGLRAYARALTLAWSDVDAKETEADTDVSVDAVTLRTFHASKGLEWPVVIPVNLLTPPKAVSGPFRRRDGVVDHTFDEHPSSGYEAQREDTAAATLRERVRLLYVAATRARERLIVPVPTWDLKKGAWHLLVPWALDDVGTFDPCPVDAPADTPADTLADTLAVARADASADAADAAPTLTSPSAGRWAAPHGDVGPSGDAFEAQSARIALLRPRVVFRAPSSHDDPERIALSEAPGDDWNAVTWSEETHASLDEARAVGRRRGTLVHAVMEALITGELEATVDAVSDRLEAWGHDVLVVARDADPTTAVATREALDEDRAALAASLVAAWTRPEVARLHGRLVPEVDVWAASSAGSDDEGGRVETVVHGVADAVAFDDDGKPEVVIDWKSDRDPSEATWEAYREQVRAYVEALGAKEGWIVSTTMGRVERCVVRA